MAGFLTLVTLVLTIEWTQYAADAFGKNYCSSYPELYYSNIAGKIRGGVNIVRVGDQTLCSTRSFVDLRYRQIDGRCNHRFDYGSAHKPVKRYMRAHYQDKYGHNAPRIYSVDGSYLPSPRHVSWKISPDQPRPNKITMLILQLGQLLDHDITAAIVPTETNKSIICCGLDVKDMPKECFPIPIESNDPAFRGNCMEFVRSEGAKDENGELITPREQVNALTSFVDGSAFYGNDDEVLHELRTKDGRGALLKTRLVNGGERLPMSEEQDCLRDERRPDSYCMLSGDKRVNEQPGLSAIHTMFHLEHNTIVRRLVAAILKKRGQTYTPRAVEDFIENAPAYTQEKLFQESKKILNGIWQKISYCDWLPIILGPRIIEKFKLGCERRSKYNPYVDPRIANAFLSAAFRFGHTLIPNQVTINYRRVDLKGEFMIPDNTLQYYDSILEGLTQKGTSENFDRFVSKAITNHLFETTQKTPLDLVALNIQRGRDHGIPGYYYWRLYYGLKKYRTFSQFGEIGTDLSRMYNDVRDVDLFIGGLLEEPLPGAIVGETFAHIIGHQFADLKFGDSHFFLSKQVPQGFTAAQLEAIKNVDIKSIICNQSKMTQIQKNPFFEENAEYNPYIRCSDVPSLDLTPWLIYW